MSEEAEHLRRCCERN